MDHGQDRPRWPDDGAGGGHLASGYRLRSGGRVAPRPDARRILGLVTYGLICALSAAVLVATGFGYFVYDNLRSIGSSDAIGNGPRSQGADANILLMGLDSRKDGDGNDLPSSILSKLHAGSKQGVDSTVGGYNTNTLILMHVPGDGSKATAFSIPRDDYVTYVDAIGPQQHGKIKEAYGVTKAFKQEELARQGVKGVALDHAGREAARRATIATVRKLTGVPIDHFAEINLAGFYDLATALGGVEVCLKNAVKDRYSGANFPAGRQHLDGAQALAFVRQRHGLPNGDLDRTHRQQAFLSSVTHQLKSAGVFSDLGKMTRLLSVAKKDVVLDKGWDVLGFAQQAQGLTGGNVDFQTLPIKGYGRIGNQDVNLIDPVAIKATVQQAFAPKAGSTVNSGSSKAPATPSSTVDVLNGSGHSGLAAEVSTALAGGGYVKGRVGSIMMRSKTAVRYGTGGDADATRIADMFGVTAIADGTVPAGHIEIDLGRGATVPQVSPGPAKRTSAPKSQPSGSSSGPVGGQAGGTVKGGGVPCVN